MHTAAQADFNSDRANYSRDLAKLNVKPLWERTTHMGPGTVAVPAIWRYQDMRPQLLRAAEIITTREAERRVLMLENPGLLGTGYITTSLYSGMQIILPGEIAPAHRHTSNAMRFIIEGSGAYSTVEGERVPMQPGDFVLTPYWCWHDHGHTGSEPVIWLDALDNPFAQMFGTMFRENFSQAAQAITRPAGDTAARFGENLLPLEPQSTRQSSPLLAYPYDRARETLHKLSRTGPLDGRHGIKMRYSNPITGGHVFPTISVFIQWLPKNYCGQNYRSTESSIFCAFEGTGRVQAGDTRLDFSVGDIFVVPSWIPYRIEADTECVLFSYSDRAAQETLGLWREEEPPSNADK